MGRGGDVELEPRNCDGAKDVPVRESENISVRDQSQLEKLFGTVVDLCRSLAAWTAVVVDLPTRTCGVNVGAGESFVHAVIELAQEVSHPRVRKAGDRGRAQSPLHRARVNRGEVDAGKTRTQGGCPLFAARGEGKVCASCMPAVEAPLGLAVTGEIDRDCQAGLPSISGRPERSERLALSMTAPARTR